MLAEVESARRLLHTRRLERVIDVRLQDQEDEILDARDDGATIAGLGPYRACPGGPLSKAPKIGKSWPGGGVNGAGGGEGVDRVSRRAERQRRRRRLLGGKGGEGEGWVGSKSFPWVRKERLEVWQALGSDREESEDEEAREEGRARAVLEAAEMVMEDVDDSVKVTIVLPKGLRGSFKLVFSWWRCSSTCSVCSKKKTLTRVDRTFSSMLSVCRAGGACDIDSVFSARKHHFPVAASECHAVLKAFPLGSNPPSEYRIRGAAWLSFKSERKSTLRIG